jgi:hypothetical protein
MILQPYHYYIHTCNTQHVLATTAALTLVLPCRHHPVTRNHQSMPHFQLLRVPMQRRVHLFEPLYWVVYKYCFVVFATSRWCYFELLSYTVGVVNRIDDMMRWPPYIRRCVFSSLRSGKYDSDVQTVPSMFKFQKCCFLEIWIHSFIHLGG